MKTRSLLVILALLVGVCLAQPAKHTSVQNDFFVLHNAIRGDSTHKTFDEQVAFIKSLGYDGVEINQLDSFAGMKAALDKHHFTGSYFYLKINLDAPLDPRIEANIRALRGTKTIIAPYITSDSKRFAPSSGKGDSLAVRLVRQVADWAKAADLEVALYHHVFFYVERADHARRLILAVDRPNAGVSFNLCHWLATTPKPNRRDWQKQLKALRPHLKMMTICGANDTDRSRTGGGAAVRPADAVASNGPRASLWDEYILPLGTGSFDTYELLRYAVQDLDFRGPIGVQFYAMKGDKPTNLRNAMTVWKQYKTHLATN